MLVSFFTLANLPLFGLHGLRHHYRCLLVLACQLHLQCHNMAIQGVDLLSVASDGVLNLVEAMLEVTKSSKSNMLGRCTSTLDIGGKGWFTRPVNCE